MRRLLLLALLLLASPASATVAYVNESGALATLGDFASRDERQNMIKGTLTRGGVSFDAYPANLSATATGDETQMCRLATFPAGALGFKTYDAVILDNHAMDTGTASLHADSLLRVDTWPSKPTLIIFEAATYSNQHGIAAQSDTLSGMNGPSLPLGSYPPANAVTGFQVGSLRVFRVNNMSPTSGTFQGGRVRSTRAPGWRPLVGTTIAASKAIPCVNCDSLNAPPSGLGDPDTVALAIRYCSDVTKTAPVILLICGPSQSPAQGVLLAALAVLDSASGGKVFEDPAKIPFQQSIVVRSAFSRSGSQVVVEGGGTMCATFCDTTDTVASIDSLASLKVPITVAVQTDSIAAYSYEVRWWNRLAPYLRVTPQNYSGAGYSGGTANVSGNASKYLLRDSYGSNRTRLMIGPGFTIPYACGDADTSIYCMVVNGFARCDSVWPGLVDHVIVPPICDHLPVGWSRAGNFMVSGQTSRVTGIDSLYWTFYRAGARGVVVDADLFSSKPGNSWDKVDGVTTVPGTKPLAFGPHSDVVTIYAAPGSSPSQGGILGRFSILASRGWHNQTGQPFDTSHDFHAEHMWGLTSGQWYADKAGLGGGSQYSHFFETPLQVFQITAGSLGSYGESPVQRPGWYALKWLVNEANTVNSYMIPGKPLIKFVALENNTPLP